MNGALWLGAAAFLLAYANGANDNFKGVATLYGSGVLDRRGALRLANTATLLGSLAALLLAGTLAAKFSGRGLVPDAVAGAPNFVRSVALGAAATVLLATRLGLPISTTHALVGALLGAGLAADPAALSWAAAGRNFVGPLLTSPVLAVATAALLYPLLHRARLGLGIERDDCLCVAETQSQPAGLSWWTAFTGKQDSCRALYQGRALGLSAQSMVDGLHVGSAALVSFARGLNDTPKIAALLLLAGAARGPALVAVGAGMLLGGLWGTRRVAERVSHGVTAMEPGPGSSANLSTALLVIGASALGSPVSTTHVSVGSMIGLGSVTGGARWRSIAGILAAWVGTLPLGAGLAWLAFHLIGA